MTIKHLYPSAWPKVDFNFAATRQLDPRITFTRASTGTYVGKNLKIQTAAEDEPRFDHDPVTGESLGLLIEESRTNYCKNYSAYYYAYSNATIASGLSPAGDNTAQVITATANGMTSARTTGGNTPVNIPTNSVGITCSLYVKGSYSYFRLKIFVGASKQQVIFRNFNTDSWTVSSNNSDTTPSSNYQVQDAGNGWYRLSFYASNWTNANSIGALWFDGSASLSAGDTYSVWMPQVEIGTFPTSAIPTEVASEVTRSADVADVTGTNFSSWWNQTEGTQYAEYVSLNPDGTSQQRVFQAMGINGNYIRGHKIDSSQSSYTVLDDGGQLFNKRLPLGRKNVGTYKQDDCAFANENGFIDGITQAGTLTPTMTSCLLNYSIHGNGSTIFIFSGHISRLAYYPRRLSDEQLQALTS